MSEKNPHGYPDTMLKGLADNAPYRPPGTNPEVVPSAAEPSRNAYSNPAFNGTQYDPPPPYPGTSSLPISMPIPAPPAPPISTQPTTYQAYPTTPIGQDSAQTSDKKNEPMSDSNPVTLITIQPPFHPSLPSNNENQDAENKKKNEEERGNACCVCLTWCDICTDWTSLGLTRITIAGLRFVARGVGFSHKCRGTVRRIISLKVPK
ncbi:hypothetical protein CAEBREN_06496 [Caenorhabditis brenneri]|uniref:Uncharacterized protein n=1 Tax=Caenorhabditis brenneri TaxID=135651 RepID=G0NMW4_CAEBE|nr:hypothetical protein CAEBREN_06496 [Caenorhabditis brenneri]